MSEQAALGTRAVLRRIEPGESALCEHCGTQVKFRAATHDLQAICNVYAKGVWQRTAHFHESCYAAAGEPYGVPGPVKSLAR